MSGVIVFDPEQRPFDLVSESLGFIVLDGVPASRSLEEESAGEFIIFDPPPPIGQTVTIPGDILLVDATTQTPQIVNDSARDFFVITDHGTRGPKGEQGERGFTGDQGEQGIQGEKGDTGDKGDTGNSAYEVALANGFVGTEAQWQASLKTPASGAMLAVSSTTAATSASGERRVQFDTTVKVDGEFTADLVTGTITVPADGWYSVEGHVRLNAATSSYVVLSVRDDASQASIIRGTQADYDNAAEDSVAGICWLHGGTVLYLSLFTSLSTQVVGAADGSNTYFRTALLSTGPRGMSAYEVALGQGFVGTAAEWLESLKGDKGDRGQDATISYVSDQDTALPQRGRLDFTDDGFELEDDATGDAIRVKTSFLIANGANRLSVGTTAPTSPQIGDLWVDTN